MNIRSLFIIPLVLCIGAFGISAVSVAAEPAKRIIALAPHIVENLYAIGAGDTIVGTTDFADYPEQAKSIPVVGNYATLSVEKVLSLKPDLIIAWKTGTPAADLDRLRKYGIAIIYSHPVEISDVADELIRFGKLTGNEQQAKQQAEKFLASFNQLKQTYQAAKPVKVFYELWHKPITTVANNSWLQKQLNVCGAQNPFVASKTDYPQVSLEQVVVANPEVIIQPTSVKESSNNQWQQWQSIAAVKHDRFIYLNADKSHRTTMRVLDEIGLLCQQLETYRKQIYY